MPYLNELVRKHFPPDKKVSILDLGCGHGAMIHALNLAGYTNVRGVDLSLEQVTAAQALGLKGVEKADIVDTLENTPDKSLDTVVTFDIIEHYTKSELVYIAEKVHQILKPNGRWIIHTPNGASPFYGRAQFGDITHETAFTPSSLIQLLMTFGFTSVRCFEDRPIRHGMKSLVRYYLWIAIRFGLLLYVAVETGSLDRNAIFSQNFLTVAYR